MLVARRHLRCFQVPISVFPEPIFPASSSVSTTASCRSSRWKSPSPGPSKTRSTASPACHRPLHHQPRLRRSQSLLQLERRHVPDPAARQCRARPRPAIAARHRGDHHQPPHLRHLPHPRLRAHLRQRPPSRRHASGNSPPTTSSRPSIASPASPPSPFRAARSPSTTSFPTRAPQNSGVTITDLVNAIQHSNLIHSPGLYEANHQLILSLVGEQAHDASQLASLSVKTTAAGAPVRLSDVAHVVPAPSPSTPSLPPTAVPSVLLNITGQPASNTVAVADEVAAEIAQLSPNLPAGVHLTPFYDQSDLVRDTIASVRDAILIGLILACIIIVLFLRDWSSSLVAGLVIPVTIAVTFSFSGPSASAST